MFSIIAKTVNWIRHNYRRLSSYLPSCCPICRLPQQGSLFCSYCHSTLVETGICCFQCAEALPQAIINPSSDQDALAPVKFHCGHCQSSPPWFDQVIANLSYAPPLSELIQSYKFSNNLFLLPCLSDSLLQQIVQAVSHGYQLPDVIIAVPLHPKKQRKRGYNQSQLLANSIANSLQIPFINNAVMKRRQTDEQATLNRKKRQINMQNAFMVTNGLHLEHKPIEKVAIVDDVITSGSTCNEISRILKQSGITFVDIWCVAKTPFIK